MSLPHRVVAVLVLSALASACNCASETTIGGSHGGGNGATGGGSGLDGGRGGGAGGSGGGEVFDAGPDVGTCAGAAAAKSYVGCDYWPTVVANNVWSIFDYAVVVANAGTVAAEVTVTGPNAVNQTVMIPPGQLQKLYLPWVMELKGPDFDANTGAVPVTASVRKAGGAYHLISSVPVTVYQFNALEYGPQGGPAGKDWSSCPGNFTVGCFSYSNDASLLLPSTAMTGNYRVMGQKGLSVQGNDVMGPYFAITATQNGTDVTVKTSASSRVLAGGGVPAQIGVGTFTLTGLSAGDVVEIFGAQGAATDLSGSLVQATHPVQVISGVPCTLQPQNALACDHIEESVFPAETLGQHYVVTVPTSPNGTVVGHLVRFFGNVDGTALTYSPSAPAGCPASLSAGQTVECGPLAVNFEVTGDHAFGVGSYMLGGTLVDTSGGGLGDPSQSFAVAVEQYRPSYIFLAPSDYDQSFVDIVGPPNTTVTIDGQSVTGFTAINPLYSLARHPLGAGTAGAHTLQASNPVGIQVMGYGKFTSYQYPGGSNLTAIAPPPIN